MTYKFNEEQVVVFCIVTPFNDMVEYTNVLEDHVASIFTTWCHNPEDCDLKFHCCKNLKSHIDEKHTKVTNILCNATTGWSYMWSDEFENKSQKLLLTKEVCNIN